MPISDFERPMTLFDIGASIFRYRWRFMFVFAFLLCVTAVIVVLFPKKYASEATFFVRLGRSSASMDTAMIGQTISIQESREAEINSIVEMLESRGLAQRVVERIGAERLLKKYSWVERTTEACSDWVIDSIKGNIPAMQEGPSAETNLTGEEIKARKLFEEAVIEFTENVNVDAPKKSMTVGIEYRARTPELAYDVVQAVLEEYQETHITAYRSGGALEFFQEQFDAQGQIVAQTEDALRDLKNQYAVVTVQGTQNSLQTEVTETRKLLLETRAELDAAIAQAAKYAADLKQLPTSMLSQRTQGMAENATDLMKDRLNSLEVEEKKLAARYVSTHPELQRIREQIRMAREVVESQPEKREETVVAVNPVWIDIENKLLVASAEVEKLRAKVVSLEDLEREIESRMSSINDLEIQTFEMQRKIDISRQNYMDYARKLEEARINEALDSETLSNVSIVNPPTIRYKHASPKRSILILLGLVLSGTCALGIALLSDYVRGAKERLASEEAERERYLHQLEQENLSALPPAQDARNRRIDAPESEAERRPLSIPERSAQESVEQAAETSTDADAPKKAR